MQKPGPEAPQNGVKPEENESQNIFERIIKLDRKNANFDINDTKLK